MSCRSRSGWRGKGQRGGGDQSGEKKRLERQVEKERGGKGEKKRQRRRLRLDVWRLERDWKYYICVVSSIICI